MIFDSFQNVNRYTEIPHLAEILQFVSAHDCQRISEPEIEIVGREVFVRTAEYLPELARKKRFEAHQAYADLQWVVKGQEIIQYSLGPGTKQLAPYAPAADIQFFEPPDNVSSLLVSPGEFVFFFPRELHRPGCQAQQAVGKVKKLVFKIKVA